MKQIIPRLVQRTGLRTVSQIAPNTRNGSDDLSTRMKNILRVRRSPKQIYRLNIQSEMLSTLPIVKKTISKEAEWRQRKKIEYERAGIGNESWNSTRSMADSTLAIQKDDIRHKNANHTHAFVEEDSRYYALMIIGLCGLAVGFKLSDYVFEDPSGVRLLYDPSVGFLSMIEKSERRALFFSHVVSSNIELRIRNDREKTDHI